MSLREWCRFANDVTLLMMCCVATLRNASHHKWAKRIYIILRTAQYIISTKSMHHFKIVQMHTQKQKYLFLQPLADHFTFFFDFECSRLLFPMSFVSATKAVPQQLHAYTGHTLRTNLYSEKKYISIWNRGFDWSCSSNPDKILPYRFPPYNLVYL